MSLGKYITASALAFSVSANSYGHQSEVTLKDDEIARIIYSPEFKRRPPTTARYFGLTQSSVQTIKSLGPEMSTAVQDIMNTTSRKYELPSFDRQMADYYQTALSQPITSVVSRRTQSLQIDKPPINLRPYFGLSRETCSTIRGLGPDIAIPLKTELVKGNIREGIFLCANSTLPSIPYFSE